MFKIVQPATVSWPVSVEIPVDGGRMEKHSFDATFRRITRSDLADLTAKIQANELTEDDVIRQNLADWRGVVDADGEQVPFSETALDTMLDIPKVGPAILQAFFDSIAGARRKN